jgi:hypothetical protein
MEGGEPDGHGVLQQKGCVHGCTVGLGKNAGTQVDIYQTMGSSSINIYIQC